MSTNDIALPVQPHDSATAWKQAAEAWSTKIKEILAIKGLRTLNAIGVAPQTTRDWLAGTDAPRTLEEHNSALAAIDILDTTRPRALAVRAELQGLFKTLQANALGAPERTEISSHVDRLGQNGSRRMSGNMETRRPNPIDDHESTAKRVHRDESVAYSELGQTKLLDILSTTENPHEYLAAARALTETSASDRDQKMDAFGAVWEHGTALPSREALENLSEHFGKLHTYTGDYDRLKHLVINARLDRISAEGQSQRNIGQILSEMPKEYWRAVIDKCMYDDGYAHQESEHAIMWQDKLVPIANKGDYARAMRGLLGKKAEDVVSFDGQEKNTRSASSLHAFENQQYNIAGLSSDSIVSDIMYYFDKAQKSQPNEPSFYDANTFLSLPYAYKQKTHQEALADTNVAAAHSR